MIGLSDEWLACTVLGVALLGGCGGKSGGIPRRAATGGVEQSAGAPSAGGSTDAAGSGGHSAGTSQPQGGDAGESGASATAPVAIESITPLGACTPEDPRCPIDPSLPECARTRDVGLLVSRGSACADATAVAHGCVAFSMTQQMALVVIRYDGCGVLSTTGIYDHGDHIDIEYRVDAPCQSCESPTQWLVGYLQNDPRPMRARATVAEPCR